MSGIAEAIVASGATPRFESSHGNYNSSFGGGECEVTGVRRFLDPLRAVRHLIENEIAIESN